MTTPTATVLHLSDLHLGANFDDKGGVHKSWKSSLFRVGGLTMQAHDPYIFTSLSTAVRSAARFLNTPEDVFDLVFVTGDISTNADSEERFQFAEAYLTGTVKVQTDFAIGLDIDPDRLACVPGNHDKYGEAVKPARYSKCFDRYPDVLPYRTVVDIRRSRQKLFLFGIDSNLYAEGNVAVGKITPETLGWLAGQFEESKSEYEASDSAVRILLLHHHPADLNRFRRQSPRTLIDRLFKGRLTRLEEGERLLKLCNGSIDLICHGHEHFPIVFTEETSRCLIVSAGTAAQFQRKRCGNRNSFHALAFFERRAKIVRFDWTGARFQPAMIWTCDLDDPTTSVSLESYDGEAA